MVTLSLTPAQRLGNQAHNCKMDWVVSSCTGTQRDETLMNCVTTPCMDMKTIGIPLCTGTPEQPHGLLPAVSTKATLGCLQSRLLWPGNILLFLRLFPEKKEIMFNSIFYPYALIINNYSPKLRQISTAFTEVNNCFSMYTTWNRKNWFISVNIPKKG